MKPVKGLRREPASMSDTDVTVCESDEEVEAAREAAVEAGEPFVYVKVRGNYAFVEADMTTTDGYMLAPMQAPEASDIVREAKNEVYDGTDPEQVPTTASADQRGITLGPVPPAKAKEVAADLLDIVADENNWVPAE